MVFLFCVFTKMFSRFLETLCKLEERLLIPIRKSLEMFLLPSPFFLSNPRPLPLSTLYM